MKGIGDTEDGGEGVGSHVCLVLVQGKEKEKGKGKEMEKKMMGRERRGGNGRE